MGSGTRPTQTKFKKKKNHKSVKLVLKSEFICWQMDRRICRFDADPDPTLHFYDHPDPDPDPTLSFIHAGKSLFLLLFLKSSPVVNNICDLYIMKYRFKKTSIHSSVSLHCLPYLSRQRHRCNNLQYSGHCICIWLKWKRIRIGRP